MKRFILLSSILVCGLAAVSAATITATPGSIASSPDVLNGVTELIIKGRVDVRDLRAIAESKTELTLLDLSGAEIAAYSSLATDSHGQSYYSAALLPQYTFFKANIAKIILPANLNEIGNGAFANSTLASLTIPAKVTSIGDHAFYGCPNLEEIALPASVRSIGSYIFANCTSLTSARLRDCRIETLPDNSFAGCVTLSQLTLPVTLRTIGSHAFENTALTALSLTQATRFEDYALAGMPELAEVSLPQNAVFGTGLLMDDYKVESIEGAPENVPVLFAANCSSLYSDSPASTASEIGDYAFANTKATAITLSGTLTNVGAGAMSGVSGLKKIDARSLKDAVPEVDPTAFKGMNTSEIQLHVANDTEDTWKEHPVWSLFDIYSDTMTDINNIAEVLSGSTVSYMDGTLTVVSKNNILSVEIYTMKGHKLLSASPDKTEFSAHLPIDDNVVIVRIVTSDGVETHKLFVR